MYRSRLPKIAAELAPTMRAVEKAGAELVAQRAKERVKPHHRSGGLEGAIHVEDEPEGSYVVAGDGDVFWGHLLEHGTSHSPPFPFLIPAAEETRDEYNKMGKTALRRIT